ncbi:hypothetical protein FRC08_002217 [Ceratobasidium sp. 394]|nr:hypothetical protein FRC08_002217 [Ceratobasidium sp. 394]
MVARVVLFSHALLTLSGVTAAQASNSSFSVISYNIAAIPGFLSASNPKVNVPIIAPRLAPYGIVNVQ